MFAKGQPQPYSSSGHWPLATWPLMRLEPLLEALKTPFVLWEVTSSSSELLSTSLRSSFDT